jgi:hypothetical protein
VLPSGELDTQIVSPGYFEAMGFSLISGRPFQSQARRYGCRVGIVNQQAADSYFGGSAVGASVIDESGSRTEIIGVVHSPPLGTFQRGVEPAIYLPMAQDFVPRMTLIFSAKEVNDELLADARRRFDAMPGRGPLPSTVKTMDTHLSQTSLAPLRVATAIVTATAQPRDRSADRFRSTPQRSHRTSAWRRRDARYHWRGHRAVGCSAAWATARTNPSSR